MTEFTIRDWFLSLAYRADGMGFCQGNFLPDGTVVTVMFNEKLEVVEIEHIKPPGIKIADHSAEFLK